MTKTTGVSTEKLLGLRTLKQDQRLGDLGRHSLVAQLERLDSDKRLARLDNVAWGKRFNIFDALGVTDYEIRHSNFIAFFFDPLESHNLGSSFYKLFCKEMMIKLPREPERGKLKVDRELDHTDIQIDDEVNNIAIVIENKWHSRESYKQTYHYGIQAKKRHGQKDLHLFFLTLDKHPGSPASGWENLHYTVINKVVSVILKENSLTPEVRIALSQYKDLLTTKI
jgi:hypothetical protein